ncbi:hypothetical protein [Mycobacterium gordonae]|uniref:hypothetical protein n=1 Tax=Mycobacterium gordonae TaxID=1778 RepID=UPI0021F2DCEB|nr:hypothetical protein [Mycobacterium gordonae]
MQHFGASESLEFVHRRPEQRESGCLMRHSDSGEYLQAPVVIAGDQHWSGFRPDRIKGLVNDLMQAVPA